MLQVTSVDQAIDLILPLVAPEGIKRIVVGLPLDMDDGFGAAAKAVAKWGVALAARAKIPVVFVDERLSSFAAEQKLIDRKRSGEKITRQRKKQQLDAIAAAAFLQEFLDGKLQPISIPQRPH